MKREGGDGSEVRVGESRVSQRVHIAKASQVKNSPTVH